ncbi:hypothetical protein HU200_007808 [Digitaria exilis]|uniref:BZIP domain-containing protein n=1 Tax=Digitaria exilis TaxID=1010633 RepID=A0A835KUE1_9POAL|nr:hypothetical protein HU200_007808 [Digitaria exilis]
MQALGLSFPALRATNAVRSLIPRGFANMLLSDETIRAQSCHDEMVPRCLLFRPSLTRSIRAAATNFRRRDADAPPRARCQARQPCMHNASRRGGDNFFVRLGTTLRISTTASIHVPALEKRRNQQPALLTSYHSPVPTKQIKQIITHSIGHASMVVHGRRPRLVTLIENEAPQGPRRRLVIIIARSQVRIPVCRPLPAASRHARSPGPADPRAGANGSGGDSLPTYITASAPCPFQLSLPLETADPPPPTPSSTTLRWISSPPHSPGCPHVPKVSSHVTLSNPNSHPSRLHPLSPAQANAARARTVTERALAAADKLRDASSPAAHRPRIMAQLPPRIPAAVHHWPEGGHHHHGGAASAWADDFAEFAASLSDSVAFVEVAPADGAAGEFDRLDDDQLMSMFPDDAAAGGSLSAPGSENGGSSDSDGDKRRGGGGAPGNNGGCGGDERNEAADAQAPAAGQAGDANTELIRDPKRSAQRSRVRKLQYISELERSVTTLQMQHRLASNSSSAAPRRPAFLAIGVRPPARWIMETAAGSLLPSRACTPMSLPSPPGRYQTPRSAMIQDVAAGYPASHASNEVSVLSPRVAFLDQQRTILTVGNSHLKQRIAALAQDKIFKDEALRKEIERLRQVYEQQNLKMSAGAAASEHGPPPPFVEWPLCKGGKALSDWLKLYQLKAARSIWGGVSGDPLVRGKVPWSSTELLN